MRRTVPARGYRVRPMGDHYIPRLLLKRFSASQSKPGKPLVFQFQRGRTPPEHPFAVGRIASEAGFYAHPSGLDLDRAGMHDHEKRIADILIDVHSGGDPEQYREDLGIMISVAMSRTRAMRDAWKNMTGLLFEKAHEVMGSEAWGRLMRDGIEEGFDEIMADVAKDLSPKERLAVESILSSPEGRQFLLERMRKADFATEAGKSLAALRSGFDHGYWAKKAQVEALAKVLERRHVVWLPGSRFECLRLEESEELLVLGDVCVLAVDRHGQFGNPMRLGSEAIMRVLPIGPRTVLVAVGGDGDVRSLTAEAINRASVTLSREFFFSSRSGEGEARLLQLVGQAPPVFSADEIAEIAQEGLREFPYKVNKKPGGSSSM